MNYKKICAFLLCMTALKAESFTALSYNILNKEFACEEIYEYVSLEDLSWKNRKDRIIRKLSGLNPDVICLQEINRQTFEEFREVLPEYEGAFGIKEDDTLKVNDGVCTFSKKSKFKKVSNNCVFCDGSSRCGKVAIRPAMFTELTLKNDEKITVINTKLRYSRVVEPNDGVWNHLHFLLKKIPQEKVLFMGDFNRTPDHFLIKDILNIGLKDVLGEENRPTCFAKTCRKVKRVDYIFASKDLITSPLSCSLLSDKDPIPSREEPSDHVPVLCHVMVK